jgi:hypothetical protein
MTDDGIDYVALQADLDELEATDPNVAAAAAALEAAKADILDKRFTYAPTSTPSVYELRFGGRCIGGISLLEFDSSLTLQAIVDGLNRGPAPRKSPALERRLAEIRRRRR